jgi:hypothetical protein
MKHGNQQRADERTRGGRGGATFRDPHLPPSLGGASPGLLRDLAFLVAFEGTPLEIFIFG